MNSLVALGYWMRDFIYDDKRATEDESQPLDEDIPTHELPHQTIPPSIPSSSIFTPPSSHSLGNISSLMPFLV